MEAQADDTRNFGSALTKVPLLSQISAPSTRARPKLAPHTIMSEKVKLHHLGKTIQSYNLYLPKIGNTTLICVSSCSYSLDFLLGFNEVINLTELAVNVQIQI